MLENMPSYLPDDLQSLVNRLAARAALLIVSKREHPALVERLSDFIQDRGAVGMLLQICNDSQTIEKVALSFWQSRTEKSGSRFEDILTTAIIATLSSVVAGILVEMWKGEFGPLKRFLTPNEKDLLRLASRKEPRLRQDVEKILPFYYAKEAGLGVVNAEVAKALYMSLSQGSSFLMFADKNPSAVQNRSKQDFLAYGTQVSRGVVKTELQRALNGLNPQYHSDKKGMTFSDYLSFGKVIPLFDAEDLGLGPNWPKILQDKINTPRLFPEFWPTSSRAIGPSPKVLILNENIFHRMRGRGAEDLVTACAGVISTSLGMTSHLAVMSRNLGIGGIGCILSEEDQAKSRFALFQKGLLKLY